MAYNYVTFVIQNDDCTASFFEQLAEIGGLILLVRILLNIYEAFSGDHVQILK